MWADARASLRNLRALVREMEADNRRARNQTGLALHTEAARCTFSVGREVKSEIPVDEDAPRTGVKP
jgi:hypothetical protein